MAARAVLPGVRDLPEGRDSNRAASLRPAQASAPPPLLCGRAPLGGVSAAPAQPPRPARCPFLARETGDWTHPEGRDRGTGGDPRRLGPRCSGGTQTTARTTAPASTWLSPPTPRPSPRRGPTSAGQGAPRTAHRCLGHGDGCGRPRGCPLPLELSSDPRAWTAPCPQLRDCILKAPFLDAVRAPVLSLRPRVSVLSSFGFVAALTEWCSDGVSLFWGPWRHQFFPSMCLQIAF